MYKLLINHFPTYTQAYTPTWYNRGGGWGGGLLQPIPWVFLRCYWSARKLKRVKLNSYNKQLRKTDYMVGINISLGTAWLLQGAVPDEILEIYIVWIPTVQSAFLNCLFNQHLLIRYTRILCCCPLALGPCRFLILAFKVLFKFIRRIAIN